MTLALPFPLSLERIYSVGLWPSFIPDLPSVQSGIASPFNANQGNDENEGARELDRFTVWRTTDGDPRELTGWHLAETDTGYEDPEPGVRCDLINLRIQIYSIQPNGEVIHSFT